MIRIALSLLSLAMIAGAADEKEKPAAEHGGHDAHAEHAAAADSGLKKELIEGLTEKDFLRLGDKPKTVRLTVVAVWTAENYGMNFNGYAKGNATYTIPKDWTVEVTYINPSPIPHSLIVIEQGDTKKLQVAEPYFKGAAVPDHIKGLSYGKHTFSFTADEAGEFALACGFPAHALNGHWIALDISDEATEPSLKLGDKEPVKASPAAPAAK
jgi:hypothetical protein